MFAFSLLEVLLAGLNIEEPENQTCGLQGYTSKGSRWQFSPSESNYGEVKKVKGRVAETNGACVPGSSFAGRRIDEQQRHSALMWTCPEGYTCGRSWAGRVLGRLILQKGRQSSGVVVPSKKGSDKSASAQVDSPHV